jgi:hypothetical protein
MDVSQRGNRDFIMLDFIQIILEFFSKVPRCGHVHGKKPWYSVVTFISFVFMFLEGFP